jgi:DNA-3-methyladenine glycosylase
MGEPKALPRSFYRRGTAEVARALLGFRLTRRLPDGSERSVILVETEAYLGVADRAAHTWGGRRTPRVAPMWGPGGHAYVYFVYGMHFCMNVVTQVEGVPEAVLLRAAVPEELWDDIYGPRSTRVSLKVNRAEEGAVPRLQRRSSGLPPWPGPSSPSKKIPGLLSASGPAKLCAFLSVTTALSGVSLSGPELVLSRGPRARFDVLVGPRVGVGYAGAAARWPLRFALAGCVAVTKPKGLERLEIRE